MASSINGANITVEGSPDVKYNITYTATRNSNSEVTYNFTVKTSLLYSGSNILNGYKLTLYLTVNGKQGSVVLKEDSAQWRGVGVHSTKTLSIKAPSTTANTNQTVTFQVVNKGTLDGTSGEITTTNYYVTSPALLYTKCTAPTTFTASPSTFEDNVTLTWSGAKGGTNNSITSYYIQYNTSVDNTNWTGWKQLATVNSTSASGTYTHNMSSLVTRGHYVWFAIRTQGSAGSSYYSGNSNPPSAIRRNPYTKCTAPYSFSVSSNNFDKEVTLKWSGAIGGTNNTINGYLIQYCISDNNSTWGDWKDYKLIATTKTSYEITYDVSSMVKRKQYIKFRIRTQGSAGSSYYSGYVVSNNVQRNPYTKCTPPTSVTITSEEDVSGTKYNNVFNSSITIAWSAGLAGENNDIKRYYIEYCTSSNNYIWGAWTILQSSDLTPVGTSSTTVDVSSVINRGVYMKIRIRTEGTVMIKGTDGNYLYYSEFIESASIRRNSVPNAPTTFTISSHPTLEFSKGDAIRLQWDKPIDIDNNIFRYRIQYAIGSKNNVSNNIINNSWSNLVTIDNKDILERTISATNSLFDKMESYQSDNSNSLIQFRIQVVDVFQEYNNESNSYYTYSPIVTCYNMTGVTIGINDKWVNCQLYVGSNGEWVEQYVFAGVDNSWSACGIDLYTNQIPISTDVDGSIYNDIGYKKDTCLSEADGSVRESSGLTTTGFIPLGNYGSSATSTGEVMVCMQGIEAKLTSHLHICFYDNDKKYIGRVWASEFVTESADSKVVYTLNKYGYIDSLDLSGLTGYYHSSATTKTAAFFRMCCNTIDGDSIITVNEEIEPIIYTNQLPLATDVNDSIFNDVGYMKDARLTVNGDVAERGILMNEAGYYATGFIPIISGSSRTALGETILYFKNMQVPLNNYTHIFLYGLDKICIGVQWATQFSPTPDGLKPRYTLDENGYINSLDISALTGYYKQGEPLYIRLDMQSVIDDSGIITVNEPTE